MASDALALYGQAHKGGRSGIGGKFTDWLFGGGTEALVPPDMQGLRQQNIDLLSSFLKPGAFDAGGAGYNFFLNDPRLKQFLDQTSPEMTTYNTARPILEGMLTGTGPQFERDIASANQSGGRFSSGNAIMRGEALRNLFNQRTQTANTLGVLAGQAGSSQWDRLFAADNQRLQLLTALFGMGAQSSFGFPVENDKGMLGDLLKIFAVMKGGGGGGNGGNGGGGGGGGTYA